MRSSRYEVVSRITSRGVSMAQQGLRKTTPSAANSTPQDLHSPRESIPAGQASSTVGENVRSSPKYPQAVGHEKPALDLNQLRARTGSLIQERLPHDGHVNEVPPPGASPRESNAALYAVSDWCSIGLRSIGSIREVYEFSSKAGGGGTIISQQFILLHPSIR